MSPHVSEIEMGHAKGLYW